MEALRELPEASSVWAWPSVLAEAALLAAATAAASSHIVVDWQAPGSGVGLDGETVVAIASCGMILTAGKLVKQSAGMADLGLVVTAGD